MPYGRDLLFSPMLPIVLCYLAHGLGRYSQMWNMLPPEPAYSFASCLIKVTDFGDKYRVFQNMVQISSYFHRIEDERVNINLEQDLYVYSFPSHTNMNDF